MRKHLLRLTLGLVLALVLIAPAAFAAGGGGDDHGGHDDHHGINWYKGNLFESADEKEGNLITRPKGMPSPVSALVINTLIFYGLIWKFGAKPLSEALKKRKADIMGGIESAQKMKRESEARLADYEDKLDHIQDEIKRVRRDMRKAAEAERERALTEARERRERMEREAKLLIDQELKAAREQLHIDTVRAAVTGAEELLSSKLTSSDQQRLADEYLSGLNEALAGVNARGGQA